MVITNTNHSELSEKRFQSGCIARFSKSLTEGALAGVVVGYAKLAWYPDPYAYAHKNVEVSKALDIRYMLRNLKTPVILAGLACGTYSGVECTFENMRDESKSSTWVNSMAGGAAAGTILGSLSKRLDVMASAALGVGLLMAMVEYNSHFIAVGASEVPTGMGPSVAELKERYPRYKNL